MAKWSYIIQEIQLVLLIILKVERSWECGTWSLEEGKMRNLCIFLKFLKVTYTHFVLGDIDFTKV